MAHSSKARGLVLGVFNDCEEGTYFDESNPIYLEDVLRERLSRLTIPVLYGLPFGHIEHQATLPLGVRVQLDATEQTLTFLEEAVQ